jgi:uncharacterized membrane protein
MSDVQARPQGAESSDDRTMVLVVYGLYVLALVSCGLAGIAGVVAAYVKRDDARGTLWESHFDNQISAFWTWFALVAVGVITIPIVIGFFVIGAAFIWFLYRTIKGLVRALENRAYV